jgi:hypothetical protein
MDGVALSTGVHCAILRVQARAVAARGKSITNRQAECNLRAV